MGELFYLRSLLLHKPARSFSELRTISSILHHSFQEAAIVLGLFSNNSKGFECMSEAVKALSPPYQLWFLFAQILLNLPCSAVDVFASFEEDLTANYLDHDLTPSDALASALLDIDSSLRSGGCSLRDFGFPDAPNACSSKSEAENQFFTAAIQENYIQESLQMSQSLTTKQALIFTTIQTSIPSPGQSRLFFVNGKAGRGKTFVLDALIKRL